MAKHKKSRKQRPKAKKRRTKTKRNGRKCDKRTIERDLEFVAQLDATAENIRSLLFDNQDKAYNPAELAKHCKVPVHIVMIAMRLKHPNSFKHSVFHDGKAYFTWDKNKMRAHTPMCHMSEDDLLNMLTEFRDLELFKDNIWERVLRPKWLKHNRQ